MSSAEQIVKELGSLSFCQIADALGPSCPIETGLKPIDPSFRVFGLAMTVSCPPDDNLTLHHALHIAEPGRVLVAHGSGSCKAALWGELMSIAALTKGLSGTIIDGAARDVLEIKNTGYPVFSRTITARQASKKNYGSLNTPILCGSIEVSPGDVIIGDVNGIMAVSQTRLEEALRGGVEIAQKELQLKEQIHLGRSIFEILGLQAQITSLRDASR